MTLGKVMVKAKLTADKNAPLTLKIQQVGIHFMSPQSLGNHLKFLEAKLTTTLLQFFFLKSWKTRKPKKSTQDWRIHSKDDNLSNKLYR